MYAISLAEQFPRIKALNLSLDDLKESLLQLNINYGCMATTLIEEHAEFPFSTFLANLGGQLGLFLGMSFLSFFEIFEILCIIFWEQFFANKVYTV